MLKYQIESSSVVIGPNPESYEELRNILIARRAYGSDESATAYLKEVGLWSSAEQSALISELITAGIFLEKSFCDAILSTCQEDERRFLQEQFLNLDRPIRAPFWVASVFTQLSGGQLPTFGQLQLLNELMLSPNCVNLKLHSHYGEESRSSLVLDAGEWTLTPTNMWQIYRGRPHTEVAIFPSHDLKTMRLEPDEARTSRIYSSWADYDSFLDDAFYFRCAWNSV